LLVKRCESSAGVGWGYLDADWPCICYAAVERLTSRYSQYVLKERRRTMKRHTATSRLIIDEVSSYISGSGEAKLPSEVIRKAKHHVLDTLSAIVSGSKLKPGQIAENYVKSQRGVMEAQVVGSRMVTSAINAAFANGMMAHADETDDAHSGTRTHPGCAIVPAALSMSEREEVDGMSFLKAVVLGYDIGCRNVQALGGDNIRQKSHCQISIGGNFGAAAATASVSRLGENEVRYVLSYAAHQALGMGYWMRDEEHVEKAFVFGGMPARNGVTSTVLIQSGFTGVGDPFSGEYNLFQPFAPNVHPELLTEGLGKKYEIMFATIKKFPVGLPIQAPLDGLFSMIRKYKFAFKDIESVAVHVHPPSASVVNNRNMPDINLQHLLAVALLDGGLSFETAHSYDRMKDPTTMEARKIITLVEDHELIPYHTIIEVATKDGTKFRETVTTVLGRPENPMPTEMVEKRCKDLMVPVLGEHHTKKLIDKIWNLDKVKNVRELRPLLSTR
jgi:2-methylcitrate dehydratase PrpD